MSAAPCPPRQGTPACSAASAGAPEFTRAKCSDGPGDALRRWPGGRDGGLLATVLRAGARHCPAKAGRTDVDHECRPGLWAEEGSPRLPLPGRPPPCRSPGVTLRRHTASWQSPFKFLSQGCKPQCETVY